MNRVTIENVKTDLIIKKNSLKDAEFEAIKEQRISSQVKMYHDMSKIYGMLLDSVEKYSVQEAFNKTEYCATFKCRLCGDRFISSVTPDKVIARDALLYLCSGVGKRALMSPNKQDIHFCKDGSVGVGDLLGFKLKK